MTADAITHLRAELDSLRSLVDQQALLVAQQAERIDFLERRGAEQSTDVVVPRQRVAHHSGEATSQVPAVLPNRRALLRGAGLASVGVAAAAVATVAAAAPSAATTGTMVYGTFNLSGGDRTVLESTSTTETLQVGNRGEGGGIVVYGNFTATQPALDARSNNSQPAVRGVGAEGPGILGVAEAISDSAGVHGRTSGAGSAVYGQNTNTASTAGVFGDANGTTKGVWGRHTGTNAAGIGVYGESTAGRGASFGGKAAQLRLRPAAATTRPASGQRGDLFVDSTGRLWYCKGSTTWSQLA